MQNGCCFAAAQKRVEHFWQIMDGTHYELSAIGYELAGTLRGAEVDSAYGVKRMTIENAFHNKYSLVKGAARRARQLQSGAVPLIDAKSTKACRVAQDEIRQGHVKFVLMEKAVAPTLDRRV